MICDDVPVPGVPDPRTAADVLAATSSMALAAGVMAHAGTQNTLSLASLVMSSALVALLVAYSAHVSVGHHVACEAQVAQLANPDTLWRELSSPSGLDRQVVDVVGSNPLTRSVSDAFEQTIGLPLLLRQLLFASVALGLSVSSTNSALQRLLAWGAMGTGVLLFLGTSTSDTVIRTVFGTVFGAHVMTFHAFGFLVLATAQWLPKFVADCSGFALLGGAVAVGILLLRSTVRVRSLVTLRTAVLQQMFLLAVQYLLCLPSWHPSWVALLPVMLITGNAELPAAASVRVLGVSFALPPALAAAAGLHARGSTVWRRASSDSGGASHIWGFVHRGLLDAATVAGRLLVTSTCHQAVLVLQGAPMVDMWSGVAADVPLCLRATVGVVQEWLLLPAAGLPWLGSAFARYAAVAQGVHQALDADTPLGQAMVGLWLTSINMAVCLMGAKWARRTLGIHHGWAGLWPVTVLPVGVSLVLGTTGLLPRGGALLFAAVAAQAAGTYVSGWRRPWSRHTLSLHSMGVTGMGMHASGSKMAMVARLLASVFLLTTRAVVGLTATLVAATLLRSRWQPTVRLVRGLLRGELDLHAASAQESSSLSHPALLLTGLCVLWKVGCLLHLARARWHEVVQSMNQTKAGAGVGGLIGSGGAAVGDGSLPMVSLGVDVLSLCETWSEGSVQPPGSETDTIAGTGEGGSEASALPRAARPRSRPRRRRTLDGGSSGTRSLAPSSSLHSFLPWGLEGLLEGVVMGGGATGLGAGSGNSSPTAASVNADDPQGAPDADPPALPCPDFDDLHEWDDAASVVSSATLSGTSRKEVTRLLRRRRAAQARARSGGRLRPRSPLHPAALQQVPSPVSPLDPAPQPAPSTVRTPRLRALHSSAAGVPGVDGLSQVQGAHSPVPATATSMGTARHLWDVRSTGRSDRYLSAVRMPQLSTPHVPSSPPRRSSPPPRAVASSAVSAPPVHGPAGLLPMAAPMYAELARAPGRSAALSPRAGSGGSIHSSGAAPPPPALPQPVPVTAALSPLHLDIAGAAASLGQGQRPPSPFA